ncbi:hypothetical protein niasHT_010607 [Heterodera trifolii]|uniref:Uncharacterized protein n=1 Tax=Heterodera trifolii TaxID=157864 RepID=A0ABD2L293_9BILA
MLLFSHENVALAALRNDNVCNLTKNSYELLLFNPNVDEVPELGPNLHDQVVEVTEDVVSAAYSSDPGGQKRVDGHQ